MDTFLPREIYLIIGILIFAFLIFLLFFSDNLKKREVNNQNELKKPSNELGKENSINLNLAITYSEMNQIDKAKELLKKIKIEQLEEREKNIYQTISQKIN
jgi:thioredoxin-like negative regulator of GroEL|tara:strand:- start:1990 stop:2292 length:303 start_codon:yes stop_codon:yes gene_type:complete